MMLATIFSTNPNRGLRSSVSWRPTSFTDPRLFDATGTRSDAGIPISPEAALTIGVVYRAINVLAHAVATVPLVINKVLGEGAKERDQSHPQYAMLHDQCNAWQTSFLFRHLLVSRCILWGDFFAQALPGRGGVGSLIPLEPTTTRVVDQLTDGRLVYVTQDITARGMEPERRLLQDDVFHVRGFSLDGKSGVPLTRLARNAMGLALAAEKHGSMFMKRGAQFSGILTSPGVMSPQSRAENEKAWNRAHAGFSGSGTAPLLEGGMTFSATSSTNHDSQWIESRDFQIAELGPRFLGVPGLLCGYPDKTATYASAAEMTLAFVKHGIMPITDNVVAELNRTVVTGAPDSYRADFVLEGLLRGDIKTRYEAHRVAVMTGWKSRAEVRAIEGDNPGPGALDEFFLPLNLGTTGNEIAAQPDGATGGQIDAASEEEALLIKARTDAAGVLVRAGYAPDDAAKVVGLPPMKHLGMPPVTVQQSTRGSQPAGFGGDGADEGGDDVTDDTDEAAEAVAASRLRALAERQAVRLVRREVAAIVGEGKALGAARRFASDAPGWGKWLAEYYEEHAKLVSETLRVPWDSAHAYCEGQRQALVASCAAVERFEAEATPKLVALAIGG